MYLSSIKYLTVGFLVMTALLSGTGALADLMLHPNRVVLEGRQRIAQLELINRGATTSVYRIKLVKKRMTELGEFVIVDSPLPGELFADDLVRYSPRQVELAPGASQTVRLMLRKPAELAPGEYRSHLVFEKIPDMTVSTPVQKHNEENQAEVDIQLTALVNVSIPIIVRHGDIGATVALDDLRLDSSAAGESLLSLTVRRDGERSVYGDLLVEFIPQKGAQQVVASARGMAVYAPNPLRRRVLALKSATRTPLTAGTLHVTYRERSGNSSDSGGKLLAEAFLRLP